MARRDTVPGRPFQRFKYGALIIEFVSVPTQANSRGFVTKEFVEAAAIWLFDAAQHGWTDFFEAMVVDQYDHEKVFIQVANIWDKLANEMLDNP